MLKKQEVVDDLSVYVLNLSCLRDIQNKENEMCLKSCKNLFWERSMAIFNFNFTRNKLLHKYQILTIFC